MLIRILLLLAILLLPVSAQTGTTVQLSATSFTFEGIAGAEPPPAQSLSIVTTDGSPKQFSVRPDSTYPWLSVLPVNMTTPGRVRIAVNPAALPAGTHPARLLVTDPQGRALVDPLPVTFNVTGGTGQLQVSPQFVRLSGSVSGSALSTTVLARTAGPGSVGPVTASVVSPTPWLRVSAAACARECPIRITAALTGLAPGAYQGTVRITSPLGSANVPVSLFLTDRSPLISLLPDGLYFDFEVQQGSSLTQTKTVSVINQGEGTLSWGVNLPRVPWLALATTSAPVTPGSPGTLTVIANPSTLSEGVHSTTIDITSAAGNLSLPVRVRVTPSSATPVLSPQPAGILFKAAAGTEAQVRSARIISPTSGPIGFQASAQVNESQSTAWLSITPSRGNIPDHEGTGPHAGVNIAAAPLNLRPGFYTGEIVFSPGSPVTTSMNVGVVVTPASEACNPSGLALVHTGLPNNFRYHVGTPVPVSVQMMDDCGNTPDATAIVVFSTGESLTLEHYGGGNYGATWVPRFAGQSISATARAFSGSLPPASAEVTGTILADSLPTLFQGGVLDNLNAVPGAALAPGSIVQIFGSGLATGPTQASFTAGRLPAALAGTSVAIGGMEAPIYFTSPGQINAQVPFELAAGRRHSVTVTARGTVTNAETITLSPAQPGIAAMPDGLAIAQNAAFQLIGTDRPARPGDYVVIYLTGMGATTPPVASGAQSPANPLARAVRVPQVLLDGKQVDVIFAGLTPGLAGLFQINFRVPLSQGPGDLKLTVSQDGARSNEVILPVR